MIKVNKSMTRIYASNSPALCIVSYADVCAPNRSTCMDWTEMLFIFAGEAHSHIQTFCLLMYIRSQEHACVALCQSDGICRIETAPQSVEATFTGRHDTFQYTKVYILWLFDRKAFLTLDDPQYSQGEL